MKTQHKALWMVSLSNGENHHEEKGDYQTIAGELSPWQRLKRYIAINGLQITSLSVYTADGRYFNLPSAGRNPKFRAFADITPPLGFNLFRQMGSDVTPTGEAIGEPDLFTVIEAQYPDRTLQIWVDNKTFNSWTLIK